MSATPRWRYIVDPDDKYGIYPEGGKFVAIVDGEEAARRIVRAVNAHDALVAALDDLIYAYVTDRWNQGITRDRIDAEPTVKAARAALKLAGSQR